MKDPIAERITAIRKRRGIQLHVMMELAGTSSAYWYRHYRKGDWEEGRLRNIARVLRVPVEEVTGAAT